MKLICLNTWGARAGDHSFDFFEKYKSEVDIFCLQEVWYSRSNKNIKLETNQVVNQLQRISQILQDFVPVYCPLETNVDNYDGSDPQDAMFGVAAFIRSKFELTDVSECFVFLDRNSLQGTDARTLGRNIQQVGIKLGEAKLNLFNFHGLWTGAGKKDTEDRFAQSNKIVEFMQKFPSPKILCGDFNLEPDTQSLAIVRQDFRDLIAEYKITDTRTSYYEKDVRFADYAFVSKDIKVKDFKVLPDEVSDHAALFLDFEL